MSENASSDWYQRAFGELYPILYPHRDDATAAREIDRLVHLLGLEGSGRLTLDLCCGNGRHAAALGRMGLQVYGLDLSPQLLEQAAARPQLASRLVRGDIRRLPFGTRFDLVVNLFTSFGYFPSDAENTRALREMARILNPGGLLVIDHINSAAIEQNLVPEDTRSSGSYRITQRRRVDNRRVRKEIVVEWDTGNRVRLTEDVRLYAPEEMHKLLTASGLTDVRFYGSFDGAELTPQAARMIVRAARPK